MTELNPVVGKAGESVKKPEVPIETKAAFEASLGATKIQAPVGTKTQAEGQAAAVKRQAFLDAVRNLMNVTKDTKFKLEEKDGGVTLKAAHGQDAGAEGKVSFDASLNIDATGKLLEKLKASIKEAPKSLSDLVKLFAPVVKENLGSEEAVISVSKIKTFATNLFKSLPTLDQVASKLEGLNISKESLLKFLETAFKAVQPPKADSK